jgi:hypothetical protein
VNLTGTWSGPASDSSGPGRMIWQISQIGPSFSGALTMSDGTTNVTGHGSVSGTLTGTVIHFSIAVPAGGFDHPYDFCSANVDGDAQTSAASIAATYAGMNSCTGVIAAGALTLAKSQ